jgi:four helix bundle protein
VADVASIKRFEEIKAWQRARELVNLVYSVTKSGDFSKDFGLRDQIRRAAGSVMHNIAEGFDSGTDAEFRRFLIYSRRSASEVQSQLYMALDQSYISKDEFGKLYEKTEAVKAHLQNFIAYLRKSSNGKSFRETEVKYFSSPDDDLDVGRWTVDDHSEGNHENYP